MLNRLSPSLRYTLIVALGGFIFGFDASVISGAVGFIDLAFGLSDWQQGFVVSSPTLGALIAMCCAGAVSDAIGRRKTLIIIAALYLVSALASALSVNYWMLVGARFLGGMAYVSSSSSLDCILAFTSMNILLLNTAFIFYAKSFFVLFLKKNIV